MSITVFQYPNCSTCRKALKWLDARGLEYETVHLVEDTPTATALHDLWSRSGLPVRKFFNTSGKIYRSQDFKTRLQTMSDEAAFEALSSEGMLIKRPILDAGEHVLVGFKEAEWADTLS